jgi:hypothetical protein
MANTPSVMHQAAAKHARRTAATKAAYLLRAIKVTSFHVIDSYLLTGQQLIHSLGRSHPLRINMALEQNNYLASEPGNFVQQTAFVLRSNGMAQLSI